MPPKKRVRGETVGVSPTTPSTEVEPHQTEALSMLVPRFDAILPFRQAQAPAPSAAWKNRPSTATKKPFSHKPAVDKPRRQSALLAAASLPSRETTDGVRSRVRPTASHLARFGRRRPPRKAGNFAARMLAVARTGDRSKNAASRDRSAAARSIVGDGQIRRSARVGLGRLESGVGRSKSPCRPALTPWSQLWITLAHTCLFEYSPGVAQLPLGKLISCAPARQKSKNRLPAVGSPTTAQGLSCPQYRENTTTH